MAINHKSGRVVVDIEPELKMALYAVLASKGMSLKGWFIAAASELVSEHGSSKPAMSNAQRLADGIGDGERRSVPRKSVRG